ncbi:CvpA family protein [Pedobacter frigoris]|uniref:CvpA family protein n=1 Tax=Pedobacter frigoris TaxID=2571272 RepID=UPI00292EC32C|nr:CvpA family protein [Pedobacter frigoris]
MNWVDIILILILLLSMLSSMRRGFILATLELLCWIGSLTLSFLLYSHLSSFVEKYLLSASSWTSPLSFIVILIGSRILLEVLSRKILSNVSQEDHESTANKLYGILPGLVNGFIWVALLSTILLLMPITNSTESARNSKLSEWSIRKVNWMRDRLVPVFGELSYQMASKSEAVIGKSDAVKLPYKVENPRIRPDLEAEMLVLVNEERKKHRLKPLKADPEIAVAARKHSADMFARGYFSHVTPEGVDPFQRIQAEKIIFLTAGENLALAQTLAIAHRGLMNSPGHRRNILRSGFGRLGIGILDGGVYGLMITQNFRN